MSIWLLVHPTLAFLAAPLLPGIINRTKAYFAGRDGQPLLQTYFDLAKLFRKGAVYSRTTTWLFRAGPILSLGAALMAVVLMPLGELPTVWSFQGDFILLVYLLAVGRFFTVMAALDTGSSFEGMGASREMQFSMLAEPVLLVGLAALARGTGCLTLSDIAANISWQAWSQYGEGLILIVVALMAVFLVENARIPIDDPNTHLELTMIHEVMVLDHGGPDLAYILYGSALKLWTLSVLLVNIMIPIHTDLLLLNVVVSLLGVLCWAVVVGVIESTMARLALIRIPQFLVGAGALSVLALILIKK